MLVGAIAVLLGVPALLYVALSLPPVQNALCKTAERELSQLLGVGVSIERIEIVPFNQVALANVVIADSANIAHGPIATIDRLAAGINYFASANHEMIVVNYVQIMGLNSHLWRDSIGAPLNIDPIIKALSKKDDNKPPTHFELAVNSIIIRTGAFTYDIYSQPAPTQGHFDPSHIAVRDFRADIRLPLITENHFDVDIKRLRALERSGLDLSVTGLFSLSDQALATSNVEIGVGQSKILPGDINIPLSSIKNLRDDLLKANFDLQLLNGSHIALADAVPFVPALAGSNITADIDLHATGTLDDITIEQLAIKAPGVMHLDLEAQLEGLTQGIDKAGIDIDRLNLEANGNALPGALEPFVNLSQHAVRWLTDAGTVKVDITGRASAMAATVEGSLKSALTEARFTAQGDGHLTQGSGCFKADIDIDRALLMSLSTPTVTLGSAAASITAEATLQRGKIVTGNATTHIEQFEFNGSDLRGITANVGIEGTDAAVDIQSTAPAALLTLHAAAKVDLAHIKNIADITLALDVDNLDLALIPGAKAPWRDRSASLTLNASVNGIDISAMRAEATLNGLTFTLPDGEKVALGDTYTRLDNLRHPMIVTFDSDIVDVDLTGTYNLATIGNDLTGMLAAVYPSLFKPKADTKTTASVKGSRGAKASKGVNVAQAATVAPPNDFIADISVADTRTLERLIKLPVTVVSPVDVSVEVDAPDGRVSLDIDAPYLIQGKKVIENTALNLSLDTPKATSSIYATSLIPTKKGNMALTIEGDGSLDALSTRLLWASAKKGYFEGEFLLDTGISRSDDGDLQTDINIRPSTMTLNDTLWQVGATQVLAVKNRIDIAPWRIGNDHQYLTIEGTASADTTDIATVTLHDIDLDYLFDTLDINNVDFGGRATGVVHATGAFSRTPYAWVNPLEVRGLSYNNAVFGDAIIAATWHHPDQAITLDADISQANGGRTTVNGRIWPTKNGGGLDLTFGCDRTTVAFLQPFMSAFCTKITGLATGSAHLFGTFADIDLEGKAYADNVALTIPFTNTTYFTSDTITFTPGNIQLGNLTLRDVEGHTARFSGWLKHRAFHDPVFEFRLTDAVNFLCYNMPESSDQPWYGKVYGNGHASVKGEPGVVDIDVNITTAPHSTFGFVLSDMQNAGEYTFITFRDRDGGNKPLSDAERLVPEAVRAMRNTIKKDEQSTTAFNMSIGVHATPDVDVTLVMDPLAGDRIRARGNGDLRLTYHLPSDEMQIFGTYTLQRGSYNFTLQDIIVKDFTIDAGSNIAFHGNPYAAQLDITAAYQTTANLADLDESFKEDKDLNRTTVPVRALLKITGDMRQPDLAFDLNFPTLTADIDRKVRSMVNTEEMMNRQVIYLLALNRFYTPDYNMAGNRNNEFASLATNTISSRISSLLGTISDNWTIAPSVRSEHGDFSDVEVDLALSSHLLNNRLLINGNLGYRDKSLNTNGFVGDFDIEYLLNRPGTIRLKAYNRFNDQTFYVKNALTTQGVGVVFTKDFDSLTSWLHPKRKAIAPRDSITTKSIPQDSIR